jgi:outer membrane receptor for Fe3+-dicitrate
MFEALEYYEEKKAEKIVTLPLQELKRLCYRYKRPHFVVDSKKAEIVLARERKTNKPFRLHFTVYGGMLIRAFEEYK